jgi:hypothetical protein
MNSNLKMPVSTTITSNKTDSTDTIALLKR